MKKLLSLIGICSTLSMADVVGGEIDLGYYSHTPSGWAQYKGDVVDLKNDLKWKNEGDIFIKAYLEHPLPILPNIKVGYSKFGHSGSGEITKGFQFGGESFGIGTDVDTNFDLKMYDLTLYYEILDNWVNLDLGLNVKYLDGVLTVKGQNIVTQQLIDESDDIKAPIPMLYAKARFDVPTTDLSFQAEGNYVSYDGNTLYDAELGARYTFLLGLGLEIGYKTMKIKLNDVDDLSMDSDFSGAYGKLVWDF